MIKYLFRGALSLIATPFLCIAIYIGWHIGMPPAAAFFWPAAQGEVVGYEVTDPIAESDQVWTSPLIQIADATEPLRLSTKMLDDSAAVKSLWPIGRTERFKHSTKWQEVVWVSDPARGYLFPLGLTLLALGCLVWANAWLAPIILGPIGTAKAAYMVIGLGMMTLPPLVAYAFWTQDDPPATSIFWPRETVTVLAFDADMPAGADETTFVQPVVTLTREDASQSQLSGLFGMTVREVNALREDVPIGETIQVKRAPDGQVYRETLMTYWATFLATLVLPLFLLLGLLTFWRGLTAPIRPKISET